MESNVSNSSEKPDLFKIVLDNLNWKFGLKASEKIMLDDEIKQFKLSYLNVSEEEYNILSNIRWLYADIEQFYSSKVKNRGEIAANFDSNFTKEEAYRSYVFCDSETAKRIHDLIRMVEEEEVYRVREIREKYNGDLARQLGKDKEEYEKRALIATKENRKSLEDIMKKRSRFDHNKMNSFIKSLVDGDEPTEGKVQIKSKIPKKE